MSPQRIASTSTTSALLLLKMTPGSRSEAAALGTGQTGPVLVIHDTPRQDQLRSGALTLDLCCGEGRRKLASGLGLRGESALALEEALSQAAPDSRDELAQLAQVLSRAERGQLHLERIVLSGHWDPRGMRGELSGPQRNGHLDFRDLQRVLGIFPAATRQVRHVMLAICFRGDQPNPAAQRTVDPLPSYRELFPNLLTLTGYAERAHKSGLGAEADLRRWARGTQDHLRGATHGTRAQPQAARNTGAQTRLLRERIFGPCPRQTALAGAAWRRAGGVVHDDSGVQRCPAGHAASF